MAMKVHVSSLRVSDDCRETLRKDGWILAADGIMALYASHPEVRDEPGARFRLYRLGLLTSAALRIEFSAERSATPTGGARRGAERTA
jgi:hypothetical protein